MPDRSAAWQLLCEYTKGDSLRKHALAVEAAMRACAGRYGEPDADEDEWGLVGLLHDFDYEMFPSPDQHPFTGANILCGRGFSDRLIRAIMGHATYTGVPRDTVMARALFATDELNGFSSSGRNRGKDENRQAKHSGENCGKKGLQFAPAGGMAIDKNRSQKHRNHRQNECRKHEQSGC